MASQHLSCAHTSLSQQLCGVASKRGRCRGQSCTVSAAAGSNKPQRRLPDRGYFAEADTKAEVLSPLGGKSSGDITKRGSGGRYESDFIWNINWKDQLEYDEAQKRQRQEEEQRERERPTGFLSLSRVNQLDSMDVDLSEQLTRRSPPEAQQEQRQSPASRQVPRRPARGAGYPAVTATKAEASRWQRGGKFATKVVSAAPTAPGEEAALAAQVAAEAARYEQLKAELQAWTLATTAMCFAATWAFYSRDVAASYLAGAAGGIMYLRLLNRSVDAFGGRGGIGGMLGQQRLLIPVILVLAFNRWNLLAVEQTGITLQLLPMLLGFFTYKAAVIGKQSAVLLGELTGSQRGSSSSSSMNAAEEADRVTDGVAGAAEEQPSTEVASVDRAFNKRMLMQ